MRHIKENKITSISADFEDAEFPATNLLDDKPKRIWKSGGGVSGAALTLDVSSGCSDVALFNTNALAATFDVADPNVMEWGNSDDWGYDDSWANEELPAITGTVLRRETTGAIWIEFGYQIPRPCVANIYLLSAGNEELYAGVATAGNAAVYGGANFRYGLSESRVDKSIVLELQNGSRYYKKRDILRVFSGEVLMLTSEYHDLVDVFDRNGAIPSAWKIKDDTNTEWLVYGWLNISAAHNHKLHSVVGMQINEVL